MLREVWGGAGGLNTQETRVKLLLCSTPAGRLCGLEVPVMVTLGLATAYTVKPYSTSGASTWYLDAKDQSSVLPLPAVGFGVSHLNLFRLSFLIHQIGMMVPKSQGWHNVSIR